MNRDDTPPARIDVAPGAPAPRTPDAAPGRPSLVGRVLAGRYRLTEVLGEGGMGAVYAAFDESLRREVAVKVVRPELTQDSTVLARLVREAQAVAALGHPAIVTLYDAALRDPTPFLVMERLRGEGLDRRLARGPLSVSDAVTVAARVLDGLAAAHALGVIHRDIKPANVFLCEPDAAARVLDFGVVSATHPSASDDKLTDTGAGVGTPRYMPPEQIYGAEPAPTADLYAVGAVLYEALSGRRAFEARSVPEMYVLKTTTDPRPLREVAPHVPAALADVVDRALARDPALRPPSAAAMREAILSAVSDGSAATPASFEVPVAARSMRPAVKGRSRTYAASVLAAGAVLLGVAVGTWALRRWRVGAPAPRPSPAVATAALRAARRSLEPRVGLATFTRFHDASGSARSLLSSPDVWDLAGSDLARASAQPSAPVRWRAAHTAAEGMALTLRGDLPAALQTLRRAVSLDETWATPHVLLADALAQGGDAAEALAEAHRAEQIEPDWWLPAYTVGVIHGGFDRQDEAIQAFRRARSIAPGESCVLDGLALALHAARLDAEAERVSSEALALDPDLLWSRVLRAERALERGDVSAALEDATHATSVSPRTAAAWLAYADALALARREPEAFAAYRRVVELVDTTRPIGLPESRVARVRAALARGRLPRSREDDELSDRSHTAHRHRSHAPSRHAPGVHDFEL